MKIKGLDFLRVYAIILVICYHYFPSSMSGGFLGVNILFVISGFLISYHLINELFENGKIDYKKFYRKRFLRIFPALLLMVFLSTLFIASIDNDYSVRFFDQFLAAFTFNYNIFEILRGGSYEGQFIRGIFMHAWSLAIEIHFYIIWPWIIGYMYKKSSKKRAIKRILTIIKKVDTGFVYFFDLTRMGSFMVGSFLASFVKRFSFRKIPYNKATIIGIILIFIMALAMSYDSKITYFIGFLLTDLISGFLILVAYANPNLNEDKIISRLADYSYSFYIFHWPVWTIAKNVDPTSKGLIIAIIITCRLVLFNHHIFEPIFKEKDLIALSSKRTAQKINYPRYAYLIQVGILLMLITSFSLSYAISNNADDMVSLEKQILKESVNQDIEKINLDKKNLDNFVDKKNNKFIKDAKKDTSITLIGDSVMLGPRQYLADNISNLYINAEGNRPLDDGANIISEMNSTGNLGDIVILALGTNAEKDPTKSLNKLVKDFPDGKRLILVTCYDNRYPQPHPVSTAMKKIAKKYDFVSLMEWEDYAIKNPSFYEGTDGVHFYGQINAYEAYLKLLNEAIDRALLKTAKGE